MESLGFLESLISRIKDLEGEKEKTDKRINKFIEKIDKLDLLKIELEDVSKEFQEKIDQLNKEKINYYKKLVSQYNIVAPKENNPCVYCGYISPSTAGQTLHNKKCIERYAPCKTCGKTFSTKSMQHTHNKNCKEIKGETIDIGGIEFFSFSKEEKN
jgi:hypothetical protein